MVKIKTLMQGPFSLDDLKSKSCSKSNGCSGIYIWGVKHNNRYIPLYIGSARNIHERMLQHLCRWRGGEYRVPRWEDIINSKPSSIPFVRDNNLLYVPHGPNLYKDFLNNTDIQYTIRNVLDNFYCCWLILSANHNRTAEEYTLSTLINTETLISSHKRPKVSSEGKYAAAFFKDYQEVTHVTVS